MYLIFLLAVPVFVLEFLLNFHQALLLFDEALHTIIHYYLFKEIDRITELSINNERIIIVRLCRVILMGLFCVIYTGLRKILFCQKHKF